MTKLTQQKIEEFEKEISKYAPKPNGCDNCWGDLGGRCTDQCKEEFKVYGEFWKVVNGLQQVLSEVEREAYERGQKDKEEELTQNALNKTNPDYLPEWPKIDDAKEGRT